MNEVIYIQPKRIIYGKDREDLEWKPRSTPPRCLPAMAEAF